MRYAFRGFCVRSRVRCRIGARARERERERERGKIDDLRGRTVDAHAISHLRRWLRAKSTDSPILFATNIEHGQSRRSPIFRVEPRDSRRCLAGTPGPPLDASMRTIDRRFQAATASRRVAELADSRISQLGEILYRPLVDASRVSRVASPAACDARCVRYPVHNIDNISAASPAAHSAEVSHRVSEREARMRASRREEASNVTTSNERSQASFLFPFRIHCPHRPRVNDARVKRGGKGRRRGLPIQSREAASLSSRRRERNSQ